MNTISDFVAIIPRPDVFCSTGFKHSCRFFPDSFTHFQFIIFKLCIHGQHRQTPFIFFVFIQCYLIVMIR